MFNDQNNKNNSMSPFGKNPLTDKIYGNKGKGQDRKREEIKIQANHRYLANFILDKTEKENDDLIELVIAEISPSTGYIKQSEGDDDFYTWISKEEFYKRYTIIEDLGEIESGSDSQ